MNLINPIHLAELREKYAGKLLADLTTDQERAEFFECGRAYETGIVAHAVAPMIADAFRRLSNGLTEYAVGKARAHGLSYQDPYREHKPGCLLHDDTVPGGRVCTCRQIACGFSDVETRVLASLPVAASTSPVTARPRKRVGLNIRRFLRGLPARVL